MNELLGSATRIRLEWAEARAKGVSGAQWFHWIAGLSLINMALIRFRAGIQFIFGLGLTEWLAIQGELEAMQPGKTAAAVLPAYAVALAVCALAAGIGWLAVRGNVVVYGIGIALYAADAIYFVLQEEWLSVAVHAVLSFMLVSGLLSFIRARRLARDLDSLSAARETGDWSGSTETDGAER